MSRSPHNERLERLPEYVTITAVTVAGIGLALYAARLTGAGQFRILGMIVGSMALLAIILGLGRSIWMLVPVTWYLEGRVQELALPFALRDLIVMGVFASFAIFIALKFVRVKPKIGGADLLVFANLAYLGMTYVRNPVGVDALHSDRVGGRPYFDITIAVLAYLVLRRASATRGQLKILPWLFTGINTIVTLLTVIAWHWAPLGAVLGRFYSSFEQEQENAFGLEDRQRIGPLSGLGVSLGTWLCSLYRPITLILPMFFGRFLFFFGSLAAAGLSGHRSALISIILAFGASAFYRDRMRDVVRLSILGTALIAALILAQGRIINLPFAVQRTLSFLPGDWSYEAVSDAEGSTAWRVDMWKIALTDSTYIGNKILGDGFGFTQWDLNILNRATAAAASGGTGEISSQEIALRSGNYHSGPVSTLHIVGVVGSVLFYMLIFTVARRAHRLILRARNTELFPTALFFGMPVVYFPFTFIVVFGDFGPGLQYGLLSLGLIQVFERHLDFVEENSKAVSAVSLRQPVAQAVDRSGRTRDSFRRNSLQRI